MNALSGPQGPLGMNPNVNRLALLPRYNSSEGLVAPQWLYDLARAAEAPGNALMGRQTTPEEGINFGLNFGMSGLGVSGAMKNPTPGPGKTISAHAYHGTAGNIEKFDPAKRGSLTGARSAKMATWFVDDPKTAGAYSVHAAEAGPVQELLNKAATYERLAQKTGDSRYWDEYDNLLRQAEALDTYDARYQRRQSMANVVKVDIPDSLDLYTVDAGGKTPQDLTANGDIDSWLSEQIRAAKKAGKAGVKITNLDDAVGMTNQPATHYAIFDPSVVKILGKK